MCVRGKTSYIYIIHCLTSDSDPYWAHADYSLFIYREKTLLKRKPRNPSPRLLGLAYLAPIRRLRVAYSTLLPYFLTFLEITTAVISLRTR